MSNLLFGAMLAAIATTLGALPILFFSKIAHKFRDFLMALSAGVMVSASIFSLIPSALEYGSLLQLTVGILLGVGVLALLEITIPHVEIDYDRHQLSNQLILVVAGIMLHNIPEGLSVGVSYAHEQTSLGPLVATAIAVQNFPEGFLVALFLIQQNMSRFKAFSIAALTGFIEVISAILGFGMAAVVSNLVPYGLAFAAGAMLFIVYNELIPESHGKGNQLSSTFGFIMGLLFMIYAVEIFG